MDAFPLAVNIDNPQSADFGNSETGRISRGNDGFVLHRTDGRKIRRTSSGLRMTGRVCGRLGWEIPFTTSGRLR